MRRIALRCSLAVLVGLATLAFAMASAGPSSAAAATVTPCAPTLPGAPGIAAGSAITSSNPSFVTAELNGLQALGSRWLRLDVAWSDIQGNGPTSYDWSRADPPIEGAVARGINVDASLLYTPGWAAPAGAYDDHFPPTDPSLFAAFATTAVRRYAPLGVHTWEIWNEPNSPDFWRPSADVARYAALLKQAYVAIKAVDPTATVLTGGTSPESTTGNSLSPVDFLSGLYDNGAGGYFDAVAHHPYTWPAWPSYVASWSAWSQMNDTNPSLRSVMTAHGDANKQIWATEYGAPTNEVSETDQASMITSAFQQFRAQPWAGPLFVYSYEDLGTDPSNRENWFGLMGYDASLKPSWSAFQSASAAFSAGCSGPVATPCTTYTSSATGSHQVCGAIRDKYLALGGPTGFLGYPVTDESGTPDGVGRFNHFANAGSIYWTPSDRGVVDPRGHPGQVASLGWERSFLGYPTTDETGTPDGVGRFNHFANAGSIYWTPRPVRGRSTAPSGPSGPVMGWERSCLGYPISDELGVSGGRRSNLQRGEITFTFATGEGHLELLKPAPPPVRAGAECIHPGGVGWGRTWPPAAPSRLPRLSCSSFVTPVLRPRARCCRAGRPGSTWPTAGGPTPTRWPSNWRARPRSRPCTPPHSSGRRRRRSRSPGGWVARSPSSVGSSSVTSVNGRAASSKALRKLPEWRGVQSWPSGFRFPNGESFPEMQCRVTSAVARLRSRHPGATIVAVSHADPIKAAVAEALGTHLDLFQRIVISPCSVTAIAYGEGGPLVLGVNSTNGLDEVQPS